MKFGIITFPGSNSDEDAFLAITDVLGQEGVKLWHKDHDLKGSELVILPGGFSYGDYLRCGAIARFAPVMAFKKGRRVDCDMTRGQDERNWLIQIAEDAPPDAVSRLPFDRTCECAHALQHAIITRPEAVPERVKKDLSPIVGKYLS